MYPLVRPHEISWHRPYGRNSKLETKTGHSNTVLLSAAPLDGWLQLDNAGRANRSGRPLISGSVDGPGSSPCASKCSNRVQTVRLRVSK